MMYYDDHHPPHFHALYAGMEVEVASSIFGAAYAAAVVVFKPLENVEYFRQVSVDQEAGTLVWPNGVDCCPDVLYAEATGTPIAIQSAQAQV